MRILYLSFSALVVLIFHPTWAIGHSADELKRIFDPGPVPQELEAATKELDTTAGMKSIREEARAKQHILLDQYVRALTERKCRESIANISELDQAIVELGTVDRLKRKTISGKSARKRARFVERECPATANDKGGAAQ